VSRGARRVVEDVEVFRAHIERNALGHVETPAQRKIGLMAYGLRSPFLGESPTCPMGGNAKAAGFKALPLACVGSAINEGTPLQLHKLARYRLGEGASCSISRSMMQRIDQRPRRTES